ncbi:E3 ubiquitin-protein ligase RNF165-like [Salvia hispanica]|uniref:E3 ubiquitin-protein ligase RNF165-like n=1 Tax=Salvia hispanica TaxID=49212 RepID=UPI0020097013|nr:E3 ubiquitin-protein ligase RNF165-like [Salvia hispanica]
MERNQRILGQPDIDEDNGEESNVVDELDMIMNVINRKLVPELGRILGRQWTKNDHLRTMKRGTRVADAVNLEIAHLGATGAVAEELAQVLPDYIRMLRHAWRVFNERHSEPLNDYVLSLFEKRRYTDDKDDGEEECCICLEHLRRGLVATLSCGHEFHGFCVGRWLCCGKNFCPLCKARAIVY